VQFSPLGDDPIFQPVETIVQGLGMSVVECSVSRHRGSVQVKVVLYKAGTIGVADCSKAHRAILPRLEIAFPGQELYVEVMSPGIDRTLKSAAEFPVYLGRGVRCYRTDLSDWAAGVVAAADDRSVTLRSAGGETTLPYAVIGKAKLDYAQEVDD
jgi:ribosome maturation factor RimP